MGDSCRYLTLLHFNMQTKRAHRYWHALFFKSSFKYTLSVGSRPLISISAMDISTLVGNHQLEITADYKYLNTKSANLKSNIIGVAASWVF